MRLPTFALLSVALLAAACNTPSPGFLGAERLEIAYQGVDYVIWRKGERVEAIRLGSALGVAPEALVEGFRGATEAATGCRTHKIHTGFQVSVIDFRLLCPRTPGPAAG